MYAVIVGSRTFYKDNIVLAIKDIETELSKHSGRAFFGLSDADGRDWIVRPLQYPTSEICAKLSELNEQINQGLL